jgi:hypothetical protein
MTTDTPTSRLMRVTSHQAGMIANALRIQASRQLQEAAALAAEGDHVLAFAETMTAASVYRLAAQYGEEQ